MQKRQWKDAALVAGMTLLLFALLLAGPVGRLNHLAGPGDAAAVSAFMAAVFGAALGVYVHVDRPGGRTLLLCAAVLGLSVLARASMLDFASADYDSFLCKWVQYFRETGVRALAENVGDYNLLYQYALLVISRLPVYDLYSIKLLSVAFDYALALAMMAAAGSAAGRRARLPVFLIVPLLPTVLLDGACWGQCDTVYAFAVILSLYCLMEGRPWRSAAALAFAFAFKLQTIFVFPVVLMGLLDGRFKPKHALAFFAAYLLTMIPALLAGRGFMDALSVYAGQSMGQYYHRLTYNAPNLYVFFPMLEFASSQEYTWMRFIRGIEWDGTNGYLTEDLFPTLQQAALIAAALLTLAVVCYWLRHRKEVRPEMTLNLALFFALFLPFVLPKMHDRYFFVADMLSLLYAAQRPDRRFMPLLVVGASLGSYMTFLTRQRPVDERVLALMMLCALALAACDLLQAMRENRRLLAEGGAA